MTTPHLLKAIEEVKKEVKKVKIIKDIARRKSIKMIEDRDFEKEKNPFLPAKDITDLSVPIRPPEKIVSKYLTSKCEMKKFKYFPDMTLDISEAPDMNYIKAEAESYISKKKPEDKYKKLLIARSSLDKQWEEISSLEKSQRKYIKSVKEFDTHNKELKARSKVMAKNEQAVHETKDQEIHSIKEDIKKIESRQEFLIQSCEKLKIYEDYISKVVDHSDEYKIVEDVLQRFENLQHEKVELLNRYKSYLDRIENGRSNVFTLIENKSTELKGLKNTIEELKYQYQNATDDVQYWEICCTKIQPLYRKNTRKNDILKGAIWNLYLQTCKTREEKPEFNENKMMEQLTYIKQIMIDLNEIVKILRRRRDPQELADRFLCESDSACSVIDSNETIVLW